MKYNRRICLLVVAILCSTLCHVQGDVIPVLSGDDIYEVQAGQTLVTADVAGSHTTTAGTSVSLGGLPSLNHDGVARLSLTTTAGNFICSGTLLSTGQHILTAAHCISDNAGALTLTSGSARFELSTGTVIAPFTTGVIHSAYDGNILNGYDVAVISLASVVNPLVPRYDLFTGGSSELNQAHIKVGYGASGHGNTGATIGAGTKRAGLNRWESTGPAPFSGFISNPDTQLWYDFDNGLAANDAFGFFLGDNDLGFGNDEILSAGGDSGGPTFINNAGNFEIAAITSGHVRVTASGGASSDIDGALNNTFGEFGLDARVANASILSFISSQTSGASVPEPSGVLLILFIVTSAGGIQYRRRRNLL